MQIKAVFILLCALCAISAASGDRWDLTPARFALSPAHTRHLLSDERQLQDNRAASRKATPASKLYQLPWLLPSQTTFRYVGTENNLERLVKIQNKNRWVTVFVFSRAVKRWALNSIYSFVRFGKGRSYIVATFDEDSLALCTALRLPCYNASALQQEFITLTAGSSSAAAAGGASGAGSTSTNTSASGGTADIGSAAYYSLVWCKVLLADRILRLGYHVHFSDVDVVYMREAYRSYSLLFQKYRVDAIFMKENLAELEDPNDPLSSAVQRYNLLNTGVYAMRSNNASRALMQTWIQSAKGALAAKQHDQAAFNALAFKAYVVCAGSTACLAARANGWATVFRHPAQFGNQVCPSAFNDPCDPIRLFVHAVCTSGWGNDKNGKGTWWTKYKLWLVDDDGLPLYQDEQAPLAAAGALSPHPFLPCTGPAWVGGGALGGGGFE